MTLPHYHCSTGQIKPPLRVFTHTRRSNPFEKIGGLNLSLSLAFEGSQLRCFYERGLSRGAGRSGLVVEIIKSLHVNSRRLSRVVGVTGVFVHKIENAFYGDVVLGRIAAEDIASWTRRPSLVEPVQHALETPCMATI